MSHPPRLRIFTFIWNTQSIRLGESLCEEELKTHRDQKLTGYRYPCQRPDFFEPLMNKIMEFNADIVIIGFQEDAYPGSYFHSHVLSDEMPKYGYKVIQRTKLMGVGVTTYKAIFNYDLKMRGLRTSIYAKKELAESILREDNVVHRDLGHNTMEYVCNACTRNKGGVASYIRIPSIGMFSIINCHLPFDSKTILDSTLKQDPIIRQDAISYQNIAFNEIYRTLVMDLQHQPDYVIYMGDFNYRLSTVGDGLNTFDIVNAIENRKDPDIYNLCYKKFDELLEQKNKGSIYPLDEGVDNTGPTFMPTGKLSKYRPENYDKNTGGDHTPMGSKIFKLGTSHHRCPSFCDRILYNNVNSKLPQMRCIYYDRFDHGNVMKMSDHAGVIAVFEL